MRPAEAGTTPQDGFIVTGGIRHARRMSMAGLAQYLALMVQAPVEDRTGLSGFYDFPLEMSREEIAPLSAAPGISPLLRFSPSSEGSGCNSRPASGPSASS